MKEVYYAATVFEAHVIRDLLLAKGIEAYVTNEGLVGALGEVPIDPASQPTVCIEDDSRMADAERILREREATRTD